MPNILMTVLSLIFFAGAFYLFLTLAKELTSITSIKTFIKNIQQKPWPVKLMFLNFILFPKLSMSITEGMGEKFLTGFFKIYGYFLYFFCAVMALGAAAFTIGTFIN